MERRVEAGRRHVELRNETALKLQKQESHQAEATRPYLLPEAPMMTPCCKSHASLGLRQAMPGHTRGAQQAHGARHAHEAQHTCRARTCTRSTDTHTEHGHAQSTARTRTPAPPAASLPPPRLSEVRVYFTMSVNLL